LKRLNEVIGLEELRLKQTAGKGVSAFIIGYVAMALICLLISEQS
jgi:hypothetical protein